jgi:hypothetical protein
VSLREQLETLDPDAVLLVHTTLGHVYVGRRVDIIADALVIERPDRGAQHILNLGDVSSVRPFVEEPG